ncbi:hypothetical protein R3I93_011891 [Phoxinus phoxinus]|uniref:CCHC-type domain-containing protein n=1 Tax=Phoxinus phoxinus TaxID=58324 RepID=A0AAN9H6N1_9TELE
MGNGNSKKKDGEQVDFSKGSYKLMDKAIGIWYHEYVPYLKEHYGFNGGLSVSHLTKTKENWSNHVVKGNKERHYKYCGIVIERWLEEATRRQQKQVCRAIAPSFSDKDRKSASRKALSNLKNDCSDFAFSSSPLDICCARLREEDGTYPAHLPPPGNPNLIPADAVTRGHAVPNAPFLQPPPLYSPRQDESNNEASTSATRSGTTYGAKRPRDNFEQIEEMVRSNLRDLSIHPRTSVKRKLSGSTKRRERLQRTRRPYRSKKDGADSETEVKSESEEDDNEIELQAPMLEVAGAAGPILVMRPWTQEELKSASQHLPNLEAGGAKLGADLAIFCQEFRPTLGELWRLMILKYGPVQMAKLSGKWPADSRLKNIEYSHEDNADYVGKVNSIISALSEAFPRTLDVQKIRQCTQEKDENTEAFFVRLKECFDRYGGIDKRPPPAEPAGEAVGSDPYDDYLKTLFLDGLDSDISKAIQKSCVGWQLASTAEIRRHAKHHEDVMKAQRKIKAAKQDKDFALALVTMQGVHMNNNNSQYHQQNQRGRGRGRGRGRSFPQMRRGQNDSDICFNCRRKGHWRDECPHGEGGNQAD